MNKTKQQTFPVCSNSHTNHGEIKKDLQRITKIKPSINKYNWEGINFPSEKDDWKKNVKNNVAIALNVLYARYSFNDFKWKKIALPCSEKTVSLIKRNKV